MRFQAATHGLSSSREILAVAEDVFANHLEPAARFFVEELYC